MEEETPNVNHWEIPKFEEKDYPHKLLETSTFGFVFPKYREEYFKGEWANIKNILKNHGISCDIDYIEGKVSVSTTNETWDPYIIIKARDFMKLIARSVSVDKDEYFCEIIKLNFKRLNKERFHKRRARLIGIDGNTIKAIQILCDCYIHVQGNTAAIVGPVSGIKQAKKIINETMSNIHPLYAIKALMVKKELSLDDKLKSENWENLIPQYKSQKHAKKHKIVKKKTRGEFPPPQKPSKVDIELETGEYFMKKREKKIKQHLERKEVQQKKSEQVKVEKESIYKPPKEKTFISQPPVDDDFDVAKIKNKFKKN